MGEENVDVPHCKHYVVRKKRFCKMTVKKGYEYCGEHQPKTEELDSNDPKSRLRIQCPLDPKHTCYAFNLKKHLKICNAKEDTSIPYISKGINVNCSNCITPRLLSDVPVNHISEVISKVNKIYEEKIHSIITTKVLTHELLNDEIERPDYGANSLKHLIQTSSLLKHLEEVNLIQPNTCFVEFGAGKGKLSYWVAKACKTIPESAVLLVEKASLRHKFDNKLDKNENNVHRIRADIGDLILDKVDVVKNCKKIVGVTKHLCGDATDLALRCLMNCSEDNVIINGFVMAFCCHHRCHWEEYLGKETFENNNLTKADFDVICGMVSWATCGTGKSREKNKTESTEVDKSIIERKNARDEEIGLTKKEKELVGKKCKLLIDYGRYEHIKNLGFNCNLYYYVTTDISLENVCIVAYK